MDMLIVLKTLPYDICKYLAFRDFVRLYFMTSKKIRKLIYAKRSYLKDVIKEVVVYGSINIQQRPSLLHFLANLNCKGTDKYQNLLKEGKVHTLNLSYTVVTDVSALGNVHTLYLRNTKVVDVSMLGKVHILDLNKPKMVLD